MLYQDLYQTIGGKHWMGTPTANDVELRDLYLDRIYDTYVDELKFEETDRVIGRITNEFPKRPASSREYLGFLGKRFPDPDSILATAARRGIPVFSPALIDSSIGIGLTLHYQANRRRKERFILDAVRDNYELVQILAASPRTAVIYIGGGTPKNWINDGIVMANYAFGREGEGHYYALQITTDVPHWGGLSGSTLDEAQSWGKISRTATRSMAHVEASIGLPLLVGALWDRREGLERAAPAKVRLVRGRSTDPWTTGLTPREFDSGCRQWRPESGSISRSGGWALGRGFVGFAVNRKLVYMRMGPHPCGRYIQLKRARRNHPVYIPTIRGRFRRWRRRCTYLQFRP